MKRNLWQTAWDKGEVLSTTSGQGLTYLCSRKGQNAWDFVLKILKRQDDLERRKRMYQEVTNLQILENPGVARYEASNAEHFRDLEVELFLVTQRVPGVTLNLYSKDKPLDLASAIEMTDKLLETLKYCHAERVLHRDIKPLNIIIREVDSAPVLIDFGLSFNEDTQPPGHATDPDQQLGSRFLLLPELSVSGEDKRQFTSDITQCVGIFFYLLTGLPPQTLLDSEGRQPHKRPAAVQILSVHPPAVKEQLERVFGIGFTHHPGSRWPSIESLQRALQSGDHQEFNFEADLRRINDEYAARPAIKLRLNALKCKAEVPLAVERAIMSIRKNCKEIMTIQSRSRDNADHPEVMWRFVYQVKPVNQPEKWAELILECKSDQSEFLVLGTCAGEQKEYARILLADPTVNKAVERGIQLFFAAAVRHILSI